MAMRSWHSRGLPSWRIRLISRLGRLLGIVRASYADLGIAIKFKEKTGRAGRQLATLLDA